MKKLKNGGAGALPPVPVTCPADEFENAIRKFGVVAACEWFGHRVESDFTFDTIQTLQERSMEAAGAPQ